MARIIQYTHRPNLTELGLGNTHDRYLVGPENVLKQFFPLGVSVAVYDDYSKKEYPIYSKFENNEFRVKLMGTICDDYQMEPGDEVIFTRYESKDEIRTTLQIIECGRVFLNPGKRENGVIKDFEIVNIEKLSQLNKETPYSCEYEFLGEKHKIEIDFSETRQKRIDSPANTDFYKVKYDGKELSSKNNPIYYLTIRNEAVILKSLPKYEFRVLLNEDDTEQSKGSIPFNLSLQHIFYGAPGTGKSREVKIQTGELVNNVEKRDLPNVFRTTFHPDTDYASFVGCYKPTMKPTSKEEKTLTGKDEEIVYEFVPQAFTDAYIYAYTHSTEQTYLVIEEINRGNCAQIFGDLFQLLDRKSGVSEYKIKADKDLANYLIDKLGADSEGIKDGKLSLPANLNILATMNTSDQSLFPMDSAFKRRWEWEYVPINYSEDIKSGSFNITIGDKTYLWVKFIEQANKRIFDLTQSEDKQLGNFFVKHSVDEKEFKSKVMFYLWYEVLRDETENNKYFFKKTDVDTKVELGKFIFKDLYEPDATQTLQQFMEYLGVPSK